MKWFSEALVARDGHASLRRVPWSSLGRDQQPRRTLGAHRMEQFDLTNTDTGVHIEGFPMAAKAIAVNGKQAERLAHLALHRKDLQFALDCLDRINQTSDEVLREAAWRSAVLSFVKCFVGGSRRSQLDMKVVYAGNDAAKAAFS
jgi:hypothetical protein